MNVNYVIYGEERATIEKKIAQIAAAAVITAITKTFLILFIYVPHFEFSD